MTPDAKKVIFTLRKGVTFHNGKTLETDDVIASLNIHRGPDTSSGAKEEMKAVEDIKADGPDKVVVTLNRPFVDFVPLLTTYKFNILPVVDGKTDRLATNGTGAYSLESFKPGRHMHLKRNPNDWDSEVGHVDTVEILYMGDKASAGVKG